MAQGNITIEFKAKGSEALTQAIKQLDVVTKRLQGTTSVYEQGAKKAANTVDEKRLLLLRAARIEESLGAKADFARIKIFELLADSMMELVRKYVKKYVKKYVNLTVGARKEPDQFGKTHYVKINTFKPDENKKSEKVVAQPKDDLPF